MDQMAELHQKIRFEFENQYWERDKFILNQNSLIIQINPDSDEDEMEQNSTSFWRPWEIV